MTLREWAEKVDPMWPEGIEERWERSKRECNAEVTMLCESHEKLRMQRDEALSLLQDADDKLHSMKSRMDLARRLMDQGHHGQAQSLFVGILLEKR